MIKKFVRINPAMVQVRDILVWGNDLFVVERIVWMDKECFYRFYDAYNHTIDIPGSARAICWKTRVWLTD